jgi:hypothetical protein
MPTVVTASLQAYIMPGRKAGIKHPFRMMNDE